MKGEGRREVVDTCFCHALQTQISFVERVRASENMNTS